MSTTKDCMICEKNYETEETYSYICDSCRERGENEKHNIEEAFQKAVRDIVDYKKLEAKNEKLEARIKLLTETLNEIANMDYRGNRSAESQIAYKVLNGK